MNSLQTQSQPSNKLCWSTLFFEAESSQEPFEEMRIVTAKSEFMIKARDMAITQLLENDQPATDKNIDKLAASFIEANKVKVYETASITEDGIFVCLDIDVIDDDAIWTALDKVYEAIENGGSIQYDTPISYSLSELFMMSH